MQRQGVQPTGLREEVVLRNIPARAGCRISARFVVVTVPAELVATNATLNNQLLVEIQRLLSEESGHALLVAALGAGTQAPVFR